MLALLIASTATAGARAMDSVSPVPTEAFREWVAADSSGDGPARDRAVEVLAEKCCDGDEAPFMAFLRVADDEPWIIRPLRDAVAFQFVKRDPALIVILGRALQNGNPAIRRTAASVLYIGPQARGAVPLLIRALQDDDAGVRIQVARALGQIGPPAEEAIPALCAELEMDRGSVRTIVVDAREEAATALGAIGEAAVPTLTGLLKNESEFVRRRALKALATASPQVALPMLWDRLLVADLLAEPCDRGETVELLAIVGDTAAAGFALALLPYDREHQPKARQREVTEETASILAWVARTDQHWVTRVDAVRGLGAMASGLRDPIAMWEDEGPGLQCELLEELQNLGNAVVPTLVNLRSDPSPKVRETCTEALEVFGNWPRPADVKKATRNLYPNGRQPSP